MRVTVGNRDHLYALPTCKRYIAIFLKLQQLPFDYYDNRPAGKISIRVTDYVNELADFFTDYLLTLIVNVLKIVAATVFMLCISPVLTAVIYAAAIPLTVCVYFIVWILSISAGSLALMLSGLGTIEALSSAYACITNLGIPLGELEAAGNFSSLTDLQLGICTFLMLLGRLELFTVLILFTRAFWRH